MDFIEITSTHPLTLSKRIAPLPQLRSAPLRTTESAAELCWSAEVNVYTSINVIRTSLATTVLTSRPVDVTTADFNSTLHKFKSATVNDQEKKTVGAVATLMVTKLKDDAQANVDSANQELRAARSEEKQAVLEDASERGALDEIDRGIVRFGTTMKNEMGLDSTGDTRKTELSNQLSGITAQRAKQQALVNSKAEQKLAASRRVAFAQTRLDGALKAQARVANANTASKAQRATVAIEQVKGLAAALAICNGL